MLPGRNKNAGTAKRQETRRQDRARALAKSWSGARFLHPEKPCPQRGRTAGLEGELQRLGAEPSPGAMAERTEGDPLRCSVQQTCAPHPGNEPGRTGALGQELRVWRLDPGRGPLLAVREPQGGPRNAGGGSLDSHRGQEPFREMRKGRVTMATSLLALHRRLHKHQGGLPQSWLTHPRHRLCRPILPKKGDPLTPTTARWAVSF